MIRHLTFLLIACAPMFGQQYTISTIAGPEGLDNPTSLVVDPAGDVYFADWSGRVRKIWAQNGAVTAVAGTGIPGYAGDGGQATSAQIGKAINLALDAAGNIYIADADNNRIRRVDALTGVIATVAGTGAAIDSGDGGPATEAGVSRPSGITVDSAGNLYFSSSWTRVRKLIARTGVIETIAGGSLTGFGGDGGPAIAATYWDPVPSAVNRNGDLYIADYENSRIRMVAANTGIVNTVVGSGACSTAPPPLDVTVCQGGFGGDGGPAITAALNHAAAAALDGAGNLYIADTLNHRIRRVDALTHEILTIAGTGADGYSGDGGLALAAQIGAPVAIAVDDASGRVYFADESNNRIRVLTPEASPWYRLTRSRR